MVQGGAYTYNEILSKIFDVMRLAHYRTQEEVIVWIKLHVPIDTGNLQFDLIKNLRSEANWSPRYIEFVLRTDLPYAALVNAMDTVRVAHTNVRVGRNKILHDPEAVGHFFDELYAYTRERLRTNLGKLKNEIFGI